MYDITCSYVQNDEWVGKMKETTWECFLLTNNLLFIFNANLLVAAGRETAVEQIWCQMVQQEYRVSTG